MDDSEDYDHFDDNYPLSSEITNKVMSAKQTNPGMFISSWEADENDINSWTKDEIDDDPGKQLLMAAEENDFDRVKQVLTDHAEVISYRDNDGYSALHRASYSGHLEIVEFLVKNGADVNNRTEDGWTPLHSAAFWNKATVVDLLLQNEAEVNATTQSGQTPLHLTCSNNESPHSLVLLLRHPHTQRFLPNCQGETPAILAARHTRHARLFEPFEDCVTRLKM